MKDIIIHITDNFEESKIVWNICKDIKYQDINIIEQDKSIIEQDKSIIEQDKSILNKIKV